MEPEYTGWCKGCNCFSVHLKLCPAKNNNTGTITADLLCESCRERFGLNFGSKADGVKKDE